MTQATKKHAFQAEVKEVLHLMVHSLYSNKEIFLRELISNASDACDKLRFEALKDDSLMEGDDGFRIDIEIDEEKRLLMVRDNGIGMNRDEVMENIGTIAKSGTRQYLEQLKAANESGDEADSNLIGQFGVGFYSAFIVADHVTVLTRRAGEAAESGVRWESDGSGEYSLSEFNRPHHGTEVILHLKESEDEFLQSWSVRNLVQRYSDHIGVPIRMLEEIPADEPAGEGEEKAEPKKEWNAINKANALWTLPKSEISDEDYQSFYQHVSHDFDNPLAWAHNHVEGTQNYRSLLYLPAKAPLDFMMQRDERRGLKLYVKRVFIMDAAEQLLPHYLRFVRGVVDSDDLPLNVSRELLQENELVKKIRAAVVRRSLDLIGRLARDDDQEKFHQFWDQFGTVLKEGVVEDNANQARIAALLRFTSTHDVDAGQRTSLADYIERAEAREGDDGDGDKDTIWYITADGLNAAKNSPHLEIFRKKGIEVLLMHDRIDEWMMGYFQEFEGKKLRSIAKGDLGLDKEAEDTEASEESNELLERIKTVLGEDVSDVRASKRLTDSAACLVLAEHEMALHLRQMLAQAGQEMPESSPTLEVNLDHPLLQKLEGLEAGDGFEDLARLVHEQAILAEGGQLDDPASFVQRLNRLVLQEAS